jgi:outer membrane protein
MVVQPLHGFDPTNPPLFDRSLVQSGIMLNWTVLDFGQRAARERARRALGGAAEVGVTAAEQQVIGRVVNAYLSVLALREALSAEDQRLAALGSERGRVQQLLSAGKAARVEGLRVDAELQRATAARINTEAQLQVAERELSLLTQVAYARIRASSLPSVALPGAMAMADTTASARGAVLAQVMDGNAEVQQQEQRVEAARALVRAAKSAWYPELRVSSAYLDRGRWWGDFGGEWQLGLAVSYPVYTGGGRGSLIDQAEADERVADEQLRSTRLTLERSVDAALASLRAAMARSSALQAAMEQSQEVVRIERLSLDVGSGTQSDYLMAESNLYATRSSLIEARHSVIAARIELARILGELSRDWLARNVESSQ